MTTIKKDAHGLWVRINGGYYRPEESAFGYPSSGRVIESAFKEGDECKVTNISQTPFCRVKVGDVSEKWVMHGPVMLAVYRPSAQVWTPNKKKLT